MTLLRKHIDFVRLVAVVMAGTFLSACMTWRRNRWSLSGFGRPTVLKPCV
jgi:hypothetical protein